VIIDKLQKGIYINGLNRLTLAHDGDESFIINDENNIHMEFTNFMIVPCPTKRDAVLATMRHFRFKPWSVYIIKQMLKILK
jgi:hypothetical protein